ncbi:MAG: T9SS type A sorting domain-containing protein [Candidatus Cloacimonetes bacterium]|nr:T9SS type A sorting domain-containing protein [Candidatus Cloacimonadota bacterium]
MSKKYFLLAIIVLPIFLFSTTWIVNPDDTEDFTTIQGALDSPTVTHGDIISAVSSTYGPLEIGDKGVTIVGNGTVYIEDNNEDKHCIEFTGDCNYTTTLENLIIQNGNPRGIDDENGGGIYGSGNSRRIDIIDCIIRNNEGDDGAGIYLVGDYYRFSCYISDTTISSNTASDNGGAIYGSLTNLNLNDVTITGNSADKGGGIYIDYATISTNDTDRILFYSNSATTNGGAIYMADDADFIQFGSVTIADNTSTNGVGGIYVANPNDVTLELVNCIIWDNDGTPQVPTGTDIEITYSDVEGLNGGTGNINIDPEFELSSSYPLKYFSPCINKGNDDSDYDDPDGSIADMGWKPYEHDIYKWAANASSRVYIWKCFPRLPLDHSSYTDNDGYPIHVDEVWENWNPDPTGLNSWYENTTAVNGTYNAGWAWYDDEYSVYSQRGYKLQRTGTGYPVMFSRGLLCETDVDLVTTIADEDWLGYFLPSSQKVLDAFPSDVGDDAIKIWTQDWCISRSTTSDPWTGTPNSCYVNYMDAVMITTVDNGHTFEWETPRGEQGTTYRPIAEHFTFVDEIDYQPVYVYFEEDDLPTEVAVYVNDVCKGAQVVEDTICQICAYILEEDEGEEIDFAFWYEGRGAEERKQSYQVYNQQTDVYESRSLITGMPGIHYEVSFRNNLEDVVPPQFDLNCYPNPFNPEVTISFNLEETIEVKLDVFNIRGQKVRDLVDETYRPESYNVIWNGENSNGGKVSSGVYYIRLQVGEEVVNRRVILMK